MELIAYYLELAVLIVGAASIICRGVSVITGITPTTKDDEIVDAIQRAICKAQKVLGAIALRDPETPKN